MSDPLDLEALKGRARDRPEPHGETKRWWREAEDDLHRAIAWIEAGEDEIHAARSSVASFMRAVDQLTEQIADADCDLELARQDVLLLRQFVKRTLRNGRLRHEGAPRMDGTHDCQPDSNICACCIAERLLGATDHYEQYGAQETHQTDADLPTVAEVAGSDPNFTGDLSTQDYLDRMRGKESGAQEGEGNG